MTSTAITHCSVSLYRDVENRQRRCWGKHLWLISSELCVEEEAPLWTMHTKSGICTIPSPHLLCHTYVYQRKGQIAIFWQPLAKPLASLQCSVGCSPLATIFVLIVEWLDFYFQWGGNKFLASMLSERRDGPYSRVTGHGSGHCRLSLPFSTLQSCT